MKLKYLLIILLFIVPKIFSQESGKVLFTIDDEPYYTQEFLKVYKKNLKLITDSKSNIKSYLNLFVNYKLKVKEANSLGLDSLQKFKTELKKYKNSLILPYLKDKEVANVLVKEAYKRLKKDVNVSHIIIFLKPNYSFKDTLVAYNKLIEARNLILKGDDFSEIAKKYSEDPTVEKNGGEIGYFTAFQMVYSFENVAFKTPIDKISLPFKTKYGYHILKVNDIRDSKGEIEVAHIMLKDSDKGVEKRIDSIYNLLVNNISNFKNLAINLSEDKTSAVKGGKLKKIGIGKMVEGFENVAFSLSKEGEISKPFKTKFGWHIIKLIKKFPIESFAEIEKELNNKVVKDSRSNLISKSIINKLSKQYKVVVNEEALQQFNVENWKLNSNNFQKILLSINDDHIYQSKFIKYLKPIKRISIEENFISFKEKQILDYFKANIEYSNKNFAIEYKDFKEGLLLFDLLEKQVWEKAKDSVGLLNYFNVNKTKKYKAKKLRNIKGTVISDYQNYLEVMMVKYLHKKYKVKINNSEKKRIKKLNITQ